MITKSTVAAVLGLSFLVAGCDKAAEFLTEKSQEFATQSAQVDMSEDEKLGEKLNGYIQCINFDAKRVYDAESRYLSWVDPDKGPTGKEQNVYGLYELNDPSVCLDGIAKSAELEPDDADLEKAAGAFAEKLKEVRALVNDANKYYSENDYKDDAFAKGKELHPKLLAAFKSYTEAEKAFREQFAGRNDALQERELQRVEQEEGRRLPFQNKNVMAKAKKLIETGDVPAFEALDADKFQAALKDYEAALDECEKYAEGSKPEVDSVMMFSSFTGAGGDLRKAAKELLRRKRDNRALTESELRSLQHFPDNVEGTPAQLIAKYNSLVNASNQLNWNFYKPPA